MSISRGKKIALEKQLRFKKSIGLTDSGEHGGKFYEHIISHKDALLGANFYCYKNIGEWGHLQKWAKQDRNKVDFTANGLKNMLRSEHIAYNIFYPLELLRKNNPDLLCKLLCEILKCKVDNIKEIRIEYAGNVHKSLLLNDNTSFDAYIGFQSNGASCGAGIEVKYTEGSYPYGKTEKENLNNPTSLYWNTARASNIFLLNQKNTELLTSKKLKQPWRNHVLGLRMVQRKDLDRFYSVHLYPELNSYQNNVAKTYLKTIKNEHKSSFVPLSFETLIAAAKKVQINESWVSYFENRYC